VKETATSASDGTWKVKVPAGSYTAGPTLDGTTIDGTGFEPDQLPVAVHSAPVTGKNFLVCEGPDNSSSGSNSAYAGASGTDELVSRRTTPNANRSVELASSTSAGSSLCISEYTVDVSAKIPQGVLVDPTPEARYNTSSGAGYNNSTGGLGALADSGAVRSALNLAPEYPECFSNAEVYVYTQQHVKAEWYTDILGGKLGGSSAEFSWNQHTQAVHLTQSPTLTYTTLTRVFHYQLTLANGKVLPPNTCDQTVQVPVLTVAIGGADGSTGNLSNNDFTIITTWALPFDGPGAKIDPTGTMISALSQTKGPKLAKELFENFEKLPQAQKFPIEFGLSYLIGSGEVKAIKAGPAVFESFLAGGSKLFPGVASGLKLSGEVAELRHAYHSVLELYEGTVGYEADGDTIMSSVVRGNFDSDVVTVAQGDTRILKTTLAVSAASTRFPNISLQITRAAKPSSDPQSLVYNGLLPWHNQYEVKATASPQTSNRFTNNPPYLIANSTGTGHSYASGKNAIKDVIADTSQMPAVNNSIKASGTLVSGFNLEQIEAKYPTCDGVGDPISLSTICWVFKDGRP
jgi:hypothetical protein